MGRAMKNLDSLLAMPYGCGEQNMVLFAPNIYILTYLQSTRQLTPEVQDKATHFLESGESHWERFGWFGGEIDGLKGQEDGWMELEGWLYRWMACKLQ